MKTVREKTCMEKEFLFILFRKITDIIWVFFSVKEI